MKKILGFLNLLDIDGNLSITNIGLIALLVKVLTSTAVNWTILAAIITAFANYAHKRAVINQGDGKNDSNGQGSP